MQLANDLKDGIIIMDELRTLLNEDPYNYTLFCGIDFEQLNAIQSALNGTLDAFAEFKIIARETTTILQCEKINKIFIDLYHKALCTSSPYTFAWIFLTTVIVFGLGMMLFFFRSALIPVVQIYEGIHVEEILENSDDDMLQRKERIQSKIGTPPIFLSTSHEIGTQQNTFQDIDEEKGIQSCLNNDFNEQTCSAALLNPQDIAEECEGEYAVDNFSDGIGSDIDYNVKDKGGNVEVLVQEVPRGVNHVKSTRF